MRQAWILSLAVLVLAGLAWGAPPAAPAPVAAPATAPETGTAKAIADLSAKTRGSLAIVQFTLNDDMGGPDVQAPPGMAICIGLEGDKATLLTTALNPAVPASSIRKVQIYLPGSDKPIDGSYSATDPETGISFVDVSGATVGKQVFAVGLLDLWLGFEPFMGVAYVSARVRVPGPLVYVTGGALTNIGSPVFAADGTAIGMVTAQQLPKVVSLASGGGSGSAVLSDQRESSCFLPVDDFTHVLTNRPTAGKRMPWIGVLGFQAHDDRVIHLDVPAVRVVKVVPDSPAGKAGLKDGDTITGMNGQALEKLATPDLTRLNFERTLNRLPAGTQIELTVLAGTEPKKLKMTVESFPVMPREAPKLRNDTLGLIVRQKVKLDEALDSGPTAKEKGLYVVAVGNASPAAVAGLKGEPDFNLVVSVAGQPVDTVAKFKEIVEGELAKDPHKSISMTVHKGALSENVTLTPK
jgi:S1-C subfamily serine protease